MDASLSPLLDRIAELIDKDLVKAPQAKLEVSRAEAAVLYKMLAFEVVPDDDTPPPAFENFPVRYVLTYADKHGLPALVNPRQGKFTHASAAEAYKALDALIANNSHVRLMELFGSRCLSTFRVRQCHCYPGHFDPAWVMDTPVPREKSRKPKNRKQAKK